MEKTKITVEKEILTHLAKADPILGGLIEKYGVIEYELDADCFSALLETAVKQQLSLIVAKPLWKRFIKTIGGVASAEAVLNADVEVLRAIGLSYNKISYCKNIADAFKKGKLTFKNYAKMSDEEIIKQLTAIKGVGTWTAEMFLIFSLGRLDIFSNGDGGLARAVNSLYGGGVYLSQKERDAVTSRWKPYRSVASLYLWKSLENDK